jgi:hypothetical protein
MQEIGGALNRFSVSLAQRDAANSAILEHLANSLAQRDALHDQAAQGISQLVQSLTDGLSNMAEATAATMARRDAMHSGAVTNLAASLAEQVASHQQTAQAVNQASQAVGEVSAYLAAATGAAVTQLLERIQHLESLVSELQARVKALEKK